MRAALATVIAAAAFSAVLPARAEYFADTPMPEGRGCWVTDTEPIFDGYRHGTRVYWRCPRFSEPEEEEEECCDSVEPEEPQVYEADTSEPDPEPEPEPEYTYSPPATPAASPPQWSPPSSHVPPVDPAFILIGLGVIGAVLTLMLIISRAGTRHPTGDIEAHSQSARDLRCRLEMAAKDADRFIESYRRENFERGRHE